MMKYAKLFEEQKVNSHFTYSLQTSNLGKAKAGKGQNIAVNPRPDYKEVCQLEEDRRENRGRKN